MRKTLYNPFLTTTLFMAGTFVVFRISPWQASTRSTAQAQTRAHEAGYYEYDAETAKRFEEANRIARLKKGILSLADEEVATRLQLRPEVRRKAEEVLGDLQRRTETRLDEALQEWKQESGSRTAGAPAFMSPTSKVAHELDEWKTRAEQQVFDTLTPKEQQQWVNYVQPPGFRKPLATMYVE